MWDCACCGGEVVECCIERQRIKGQFYQPGECLYCERCADKLFRSGFVVADEARKKMVDETKRWLKVV